MPQVKSEGIVLRSVNWKENSRIVTIFTEDTGVQSIIDRGGRSLKSKRGRLMNFARLEIEYFKSERSGMGYFTEIEPVEIFEFDREGTLGRLTFGSAALELLGDLLPKEEPQEEIYYLTIHFLRIITDSPKNGVIPVFLGYFLKLLSYLGYRPNFAGCYCGRERVETVMTNAGGGKYHIFSPQRGGLVCKSCQIAGDYYIKLQSDRLEKVYNLQTASLAEAGKIRLRLEEAEEILELLSSFLKYQTDSKDLKSLIFLEKLKRTNLKG